MSYIDCSERAVVGGTIAWSICRDDPLPRDVARLNAEHFANRDLGVVWTAVEDLIADGVKPDLCALAPFVAGRGLGEWSARLAELADEASIVNLDYHARAVRVAGQKRAVERAVHDAITRGDSDAESLAAIVDGLRQAQRVVGDDGLVAIKEPLRQAYQRIEQMVTDPTAARIAATGLQDLDKMLIMEESGLTVLAARPSMGKSALAGSIARYAAKDSTRGSVAFFSLEMSTVSLILRMLQCECGLGRDDIRDARHLSALASAINEMYKLDLLFDDRSSLSPDDMSQSIKASGRKMRLVVVDYLQLAGLDANLERQDLRIGGVMKGLKRIAKDHRCHVLALAQLNRECEKRSDKRPQLSDLRDSGEIEQDADNVLFLYRDDYYDPTAKPGVAEVIVAKQRNGPTGKVEVAWRRKLQQFADLAK